MERGGNVRSIKLGLKKRNMEQFTMIVCTIVVFLAQLSEMNHSNAIMILGYLIALSHAFVSNQSMLMGMNLFFLSDNSILDVGGISIQLVIMCIYLIRFSLFRRGKVYTKTLFAGLLIAGYSIIYMNQGLECVLQGLKFAVMIIFLTEYLSEDGAMTRSNYEKQLSFAVMGVFLSVVAAICVNPSMLLFSRIALSEDSNWNLLGILSALLFSHSFMMCFIKKEHGNRYILYSILMAICALITTSRTALLVASIGAIWTLLFVNKKGTIVRKGMIFLAVAVFLLLLANGTFNISFVDKLIDRIINPRRGDVSNGRFTLWSAYIEYLATHLKVLIFGHGKTTIEGIHTLTSEKSLMAHNMFIEQITMYGIVGTIIVVCLYGSSIKRIVKKNLYPKSFKFVFTINILLIFVTGMFSHVITSVLVTIELYLGLFQAIVLSKEA